MTFLHINHQIQTLNLMQSLNRELGLTVVMERNDQNQAFEYAGRLVVLHGAAWFRKARPRRSIQGDVLASVFEIRAHIRVSPIEGALLCYGYAALPGMSNGTDAGYIGPV